MVKVFLKIERVESVHLSLSLSPNFLSCVYFTLVPALAHNHMLKLALVEKVHQDKSWLLLYVSTSTFYLYMFSSLLCSWRSQHSLTSYQLVQVLLYFVCFALLFSLSLSRFLLCKFDCLLLVLLVVSSLPSSLSSPSSSCSCSFSPSASGEFVYPWPIEHLIRRQK